MQIVLQTDKGLCLAACCAMLTDFTLDMVLAECRILESRHGIRYLPESEAVKFLAKYRLYYGLRLKPTEKLSSEYCGFNVTFFLDDSPAILAVKSVNFEDFQHAVVWDNQRRKILDPLHAEPQVLEDYEVLEWVPVSPI